MNQSRKKKTTESARASEKKKQSVVTGRLEMRAWEDALYPLGIYYVLSTIFMILAEGFIGGGRSNYMLWQVASTAMTLPIFYFMFYRPDTILYPNPFRFRKELVPKTLMIVVVSMLLGVGLNNLLYLSPLAKLSTGFIEANTSFYGGGIGWRLLGSGLLIPVLEELVYRGVIFQRIKRHKGFIWGAFWSALLFGLMHFNVMQFIYGFLFGMALALFVEYTGHLYGAIVGHMAANLFAIVRTETGFLGETASGQWWSWLITAGFVLLAVLGLYFIAKKTGVCDRKS